MRDELLAARGQRRNAGEIAGELDLEMLALGHEKERIENKKAKTLVGRPGQAEPRSAPQR